MKTTYNLSVVAECPIDAAQITLTIKLVSSTQIMVEHLLEVIDGLLTAPITQEDFTEMLRDSFPFADITTVGLHSGVEIVCEL